MIEPTFDLDNPNDSSFGPPDTPQFTNEQPGCNQTGLDFALEKGSDDDITRPFTLEEECPVEESEVSVSLSMANQFVDGLNQQISNQMPVSNDVEDMDFEPVKCTSFIFSNHVERREKPRDSFNKSLELKGDRRELQTQQYSQPFEKCSNKGTRLNMLFLDQQNDEVLPKEREKKRQLWFSEQNDPDQENRIKVSFILKNEPEKENMPTNNSIQPQKQKHDEKTNEILQTNTSSHDYSSKKLQLKINPLLKQAIHSTNSSASKQIQEVVSEKEKQLQVSLANQSEADSLNFSLLSIEQKEQQIDVHKLESSSAYKQNKPQSLFDQSQELPVIPQENSASLNDQSGTSELVVNVAIDDSTFLHSSVSERQESIPEENPRQLSPLASKHPQIRENPTSFWKVTVIERKTEDKRERRRPCQYWVGESVRYLKNNKVMTCYRRQFEDIFLNLKHPSEVAEATTILAQGNYMKGSLTMKPRSKINFHPMEGNIRFKSFKKNVYFVFTQHEVIISNNRGFNKLCLTNPSIHSIRNSLSKNCKFYVTIQREQED